MRVENWIFVTGSPRSGTTFLGHMLSAPLRVDYIHEPFNPDCGLPGVEQRYLYLRPDGSDDDAYRAVIDGMFRYQFRLRTGYYPEDSVTKKAVKALVGSRGPFYLRLAKLNPFHDTAVVKDPVGCLLSAYLAKRHGVRPVVIVRHPVAVAASMKRLGWHPSLGFVADQPNLVADYFGSDPAADADVSTTVRASAWEWAILNKVLMDQVRANPDWLVIRHETLCAEPAATFRGLYDRFSIPWSDRIERRVLRQTSADNPREARGGRTQDFSRDSRQLLQHRIATLSPEERREVFEITWPVAESLYSAESYQMESP